MKNFVQPGDTLTIAAPGNIDSGEVVLAGNIVGVACGDAGSGEDLDVKTSGVFDLPKASADVFTLGAVVHFDTVNQLAHSHADTDSNSAGLSTVTLGVAVAAAGAGVTTVRVKLGIPATLV